MPNIYVTKTVYERLQALRTKRSGTLSTAVGSILDEFVGRQFDLSATKDTGFIGAIGETIAWRYLSTRGIIALKLGAGGPLGDRTDIFSRPENRLTEEQLRFLGSAREHLSWDFVGYSRQDSARHSIEPSGTQACLIEVKTGRPGKRVDGFRPEGRKGMTPEDLRAARRLGFKLLLVHVELTDDWQAIVTDQEIPVD